MPVSGGPVLLVFWPQLAGTGTQLHPEDPGDEPKVAAAALGLPERVHEKRVEAGGGMASSWHDLEDPAAEIGLREGGEALPSVSEGVKIGEKALPTAPRPSQPPGGDALFFGTFAEHLEVQRSYSHWTAQQTANGGPQLRSMAASEQRHQHRLRVGHAAGEGLDRGHAKTLVRVVKHLLRHGNRFWSSPLHQSQELAPLRHVSRRLHAEVQRAGIDAPEARGPLRPKPDGAHAVQQAGAEVEAGQSATNNQLPSGGPHAGPSVGEQQFEPVVVNANRQPDCQRMSDGGIRGASEEGLQGRYVRIAAQHCRHRPPTGRPVGT